MKYHFSISFLIRFSLSQSNSPVKDREKKCRVPLFRFIQRAKPRFYLPVFHGKVILESGGKTLAIAFAFMAPSAKMSQPLCAFVFLNNSCPNKA
jgi:hypothetical protein